MKTRNETVWTFTMQRQTHQNEDEYRPNINHQEGIFSLALFHLGAER